MASKRRIRRKACGSKTRHTSLEFAKIAASKRQRLHAYKCDFCGGFHVGHMPFQIRQMIDGRREEKKNRPGQWEPLA